MAVTVALIGASRGVGFELARQYADAGDRVLAFCRAPATAQPLQQLARESEGMVTVHAIDVASDAWVVAAAASVADIRIDVLLHVAGIAGNGASELDPGSSDWSEWQEVFNVNTLGPLRVFQAFRRQLPRGAKFMAVSSQVGTSIWHYGGSWAYGATKAALNRLILGVHADMRG
jgi:NAD(P)-dependent dehydrogenase (short-subunit alcohol dehydrogenase family)